MSAAENIIGGYRLLNLLYPGQSSQVWECSEIVSGRHFALKMLLPEARREQIHRGFLFHEAGVGMKLHHPNIVRMVKIVKDPKNPYLVSEFFPSVNLGLRLKRGQQRSLISREDMSHTIQPDLLQSYARVILEQAANGLAHLHEAGWVHRDVKPDNILVNSAAEVRVIDFALATPINRGGFFQKLFRKKGAVMGTRSYMSPEQIKNQPLDERADLYSFGITMYEMLSGRLPFVGGNPTEILNKQMYEKPVSPQAYNPHLTDDCAKLILRLIAKNKKERPANFSEFLVNLHSIRIFPKEKVKRRK